MSKQFIDWEHEEWNKAHKIEVGQTFYNKDGETFVVIRRLSREEAIGLQYSENNCNDYYEVKFTLTGYKQIFHRGNIIKGKVKDYKSGSVHGVGIVGKADYVKTYRKAYDLWAGFIQRCYDNSWLSKHPWYRGVIVHPRWLKLENFIEDLPSLPNYDKWVSGEDYDIDKDKLSPKGMKIYSRETCMFLPKSDNRATRKKVR